MGVNLPAHLVVVKSTQLYVMGCYQEYTETQVLQMIGRAGRPQVFLIIFIENLYSPQTVGEKQQQCTSDSSKSVITFCP